MLSENTKFGRKAKRFVIQVGDRTGTVVHSVELESWTTVSQLKKKLKHKEDIPPEHLRLWFKNAELKRPHWTLADYGIEEGDLLRVVPSPQFQQTVGLIQSYQIFGEAEPEHITLLLRQLEGGLRKRFVPELAEEGTSGSYFLYNAEKKKTAIFKPFDQEPFTPNNPRGYEGSMSLRKGILSGEQATREVAAYLIDREGFHGVPATSYVQFYHPSWLREGGELPLIRTKSNITDWDKCPIKVKKVKHGSLQEFVRYKDMASNYSSSKFSVDEVHKIALLDIRLLNADRNEENILLVEGARKGEFKLVPIDHGLSIPDCLEIYSYELAWVDYPQSKSEFSKETLDFIARIDPEADAVLLRERLGFREICLRNFRCAGIFLKEAARLRFTLYEMGCFLYREEAEEGEDEKSQIQKLIEKVEQLYLNAKSNPFSPFARILNPNHNPILETIKEEEEGSVQLSRAFSQPSIKQSQKVRDRRLRKRMTKDPAPIELKQFHQEWDELFFRYFEQQLRIFLEEKKRAKGKRRNRSNSEQIFE